MTSRSHLATFALAIAIAACHRKSGSGDDAGTALPATSSINVEPGAAEDAWALARDGDPLELARLADEVGAEDLADVAADTLASEDDRVTAIRALAYVEDPTPALGVLCGFAAGPSIERSTLALQTLAQVASKRHAIEEIEGGAWRRCGAELSTHVPPTESATRRALTVRVLAALADRGALDPAKVPTP